MNGDSHWLKMRNYLIASGKLHNQNIGYPFLTKRRNEKIHFTCEIAAV